MPLLRLDRILHDSAMIENNAIQRTCIADIVYGQFDVIIWRIGDVLSIVFSLRACPILLGEIGIKGLHVMHERAVAVSCINYVMTVGK